MEGKVKTANSKGFGFITTDGDIDWFFHHTSYNGSWRILIQKFLEAKEGGATLQVTFDKDKTATDGLRAINVSLVE